MSDTTRAESVELKFGDLIIRGLRVDGMEGYYCSMRQLAAALSLSSSVQISRVLKQNSAEQKCTEKRLEILPCKQNSAEQATFGHVYKVTLLSYEVVNQLLLHFSRTNDKAFAVVGACVEDSLTRRTDAAFGVHKSEADYQALVDAAYNRLREKFRKQYIPLFHKYLDTEWQQLQQIPTGIKCKSHWRAHQVYELKRNIKIDERTKVHDYNYSDLQVYEQAILDYDCFRRAGAKHRVALGCLKRISG